MATMDETADRFAAEASELAGLPRVSLRWDTPAQAEPRTERAKPSAFPSV